MNEAKRMENLLAGAKILAKSAHKDQFDKAGKPYINHLIAVADLVKEKGIEYEIVAWLHDVVEDSHITLEAIENILLYTSDDVEMLDAIDMITKRDEHKLDYGAYINRVASNEISRVVKIADYTHNADLSRIAKVKFIDRLRKAKYDVSKMYLETFDHAARICREKYDRINMNSKHF